MERLTMVRDDDQPKEVARPPSRSGQPWSDADYECIVEAVRAGKGIDGIAHATSRSAQVVQQRLVRMLPVEERGCLRDRVLGALRTHLADPAYDWQRALLLTAPPTPIVHEERVLSGFSGLPAQDLVTIADALLDHGTPSADELLARLDAEVADPLLWRHVEQRTAERMLRRAHWPLAPYEADQEAAARVLELRRLSQDPHSHEPQEWVDGWVGRHRDGRDEPRFTQPW